MRCTKCHYLSFEPEPRCKNCGHDLSLEEGSLFDNPDHDAEGFEKESRSYGSGQTAAAVLAPPKAAAAAGSNRIPTSELPLFVQSMPGVSSHLADLADEPEDLEPLVKVPSRPRNPGSVRRATPDPAKLRAKYGMSPTPEPDLWSNLPPDPIDSVNLHDEAETFQDLPLTSQPTSMEWPTEPMVDRMPVGWQDQVVVGAGTRFVSAAIDGALIAGIAATVLYLTLQVSGLSLAQIGLLPVFPIAGLLLLVTIGYQLMFTVASGQTVGKMAMNIRVVGTSPESVLSDRLSVSQAALRTLAAIPSALMLGLGFVPAIGGSGLTVHDRIAHTRVVRL